MVGQFDTFHGGLNLVGAPWDRSTFHLSQAVEMSNCDVTAGGLQGERSPTIMFDCPPNYLPASMGWSGSGPFGGWVLSTDKRTYSRYNDRLCYSDDTNGGIYLSTRLNTGSGYVTEFVEVGVPAPSRDAYAGLSVSRSNLYKIAGSNPGVPGNCYVQRQRLIIISSISLDGFVPGDWICSVDADGEKRFARIVEINAFAGDVTDLAETGGYPEGEISIKRITVSHTSRDDGYLFSSDHSQYQTVVIIPSGVPLHESNGLRVYIYPECGFITEDSDGVSDPFDSFSGYMFEQGSLVTSEVIYVDMGGDNYGGVVEPNDLLIHANQLVGYIRVLKSQSENNRSLGFGSFRYVMTYVDEYGNEGPEFDPGVSGGGRFNVTDDDREYTTVDVLYAIGRSSLSYTVSTRRVGKGTSSRNVTITGTAEEIQALIDRMEASESPNPGKVRITYSDIEADIHPDAFETTAKYVPLPPEEQADVIGKKQRPVQVGVAITEAVRSVMREGWKLRLYRTNADGTNYFLVKQFNLAEIDLFAEYLGLTWLDCLDDLTLIGNPPLTSGQNQPPVWVKEDGSWQQAGLRFLTHHAGRFFAVHDRRLYWSSAGNIHSWPISQWRGFVDEPQALLSLHDELLVIGRDWVYRLRGRDPSSFAFEKVPTTLGVQSPDLVQVIGGSAQWVNQAGICRYNGYNVDVISRSTLGRDYPFDEIAFVTSYHDQFLGICSDGRWLLFRGGDLPTPTTGHFGYSAVRCAGHNPLSNLPNVVALVHDGWSSHVISELFSGERSEFEFLTGVDHGNLPGVLKNFTRVTVQADGNVEVWPIIDGVQLSSIEINNGRSHDYIGNDTRGYGIQFRVKGRGPLRLIRYHAQEQEDR